MTESFIYDLMIILTAGLLAGLICRRFSVSVLIGYLVVGAILGRGALGWVLDTDHQVEVLAEAGVFLLLFSIGLEFSLDDLKDLGINLIIGSSAQMLLVMLPVMGILIGFGLNWQSAVLIAGATAFSSTVLVFKALSEWGQSSEPHGRRAIGVLLFQDAALVPMLLVVPLLTGAGKAAGPFDYLLLVAISALFVVAVVGLRYGLAKWVIPMFAEYRSPELVILSTLVSLGGVTLLAYEVGLPASVGAFAAGIIFNGNRWTKQIDALVLPFRETFAAVFFVGLGLIFDPRLLLNEPVTMLSCLVGLILIKATAATIALRITGLQWKPSLGMGIGLAHVGEFAFVLVLLGLESGALSEQDYRRTVAIAVGSLILTPALMKIGLRWTQNDEPSPETKPHFTEMRTFNERATVVGAGPIGGQVASQLEIAGKDVCLIDLSPINLHPFAQEGFRTVTGDATDASTLVLAHADEASITAVCVPQDEVALRVVQVLRQINPAGIVLVRCRYQLNAAKLRRLGAHEVVSEEVEASNALLRILNRFGH